MALEGTAVSKLADAIKAALPELSPADQRVATAVYRLLSGGEPGGGDE